MAVRLSEITSGDNVTRFAPIIAIPSSRRERLALRLAQFAIRRAGRHCAHVGRSLDVYWVADIGAALEAIADQLQVQLDATRVVSL